MDKTVVEKFCNNLGLTEEQIKIYEDLYGMGHVATRYLLDNAESASDDGLATLFGYLALQDRSDFYKNKTKPFTRDFDLQIYNDITNICT